MRCIPGIWAPSIKVNRACMCKGSAPSRAWRAPIMAPKRAPLLGIGARMCCASGGLGSAAVSSHIALTMGVHAQGNWRWVNEAKPGAQPKGGYVSTVPGDRLTLRVTRDPEPGLAGSLRHSRVACSILAPSNPSETL